MDEMLTGGEKNKTLVIVILVLAALCLCLLVVVFAGGLLYLLLPRSSSSLSISMPIGEPTTTFASELRIEPYLPGPADLYDTLVEYVYGYQDFPEPGLHEWTAGIAADDEVIVQLGWCTLTQDLLEQNLSFIEYSVVVNGQSVEMYNFATQRTQESDRYCQTYLGLIPAWPVGEQTITTVMRITEQINDGWDDYPAGDYTDRFLITVTP